jgi:hypothetical protein
MHGMESCLAEEVLASQEGQLTVGLVGWLLRQCVMVRSENFYDCLNV